MKKDEAKTSSYMTRAMKSRDPRYAKILGKLGYDRKDMVAGGNLNKQIKNNKAKQQRQVIVDKQIENFHQQRDSIVEHEANQNISEEAVEHLESQQQSELEQLDLAALRAKYKEVFSKQPYYGWDEDKLRQLIKEAQE